MIIELFGLPGSGKTTLARMLAEKNDFEVIKIRNRGELVFLNFIYFFKYPIKFSATLFYVIKNSRGWADFYCKFANTFLHHNAKYQKALKSNKVILDQGYFQNILSVFEGPISEQFLKKYLKFLLFPDRLVILDLPIFVIERRVKERGYFSRQNQSQDYLEKWLEAVKSNYSLFLRSLGQAGMNYAIIDAGKSADDVYRDVYNLLNPPQPSFKKEGVEFK